MRLDGFHLRKVSQIKAVHSHFAPGNETALPSKASVHGVGKLGVIALFQASRNSLQDMGGRVPHVPGMPH